MKVIILDGARFTTRTSAHVHIAQSLGFPSYYGNNLDALADCLSEIGCEIAVVMINIGDARTSLGEYADSIVATFAEVLGPDCRFTAL